MALRNILRTHRYTLSAARGCRWQPGAACVLALSACATYHPKPLPKGPDLARLPELEQTTDAARRSFEQGNMSAGTYINLRSSLLAKRVEAIRLRASLQEAQAALETLLGMPLSPHVSHISGDAS